jgi:hypothetical protein
MGMARIVGVQGCEVAGWVGLALAALALYAALALELEGSESRRQP